MDVHECASNQHGFGPSFGLWPSSFSVLALDHGPHHFMLQNSSKTGTLALHQPVPMGIFLVVNLSLNLHLLCLILKYLDLILVGLVLWALLEDGCA